MNYIVRFTSLADSDLVEILDYIAQDSPLKALHFIDSLQERIKTTLSTFPNGGSTYKHFRYLSFDNYVVVYFVQEGKKEVFLHLVSEGHRQWRSVLSNRL
ncbi:MAG: plasmid stabilization system protein ParE [Parasphingorhabdus sp.]|jgi:plasmid stabilization system protein ParE